MVTLAPVPLQCYIRLTEKCHWVHVTVWPDSYSALTGSMGGYGNGFKFSKKTLGLTYTIIASCCVSRGNNTNICTNLMNDTGLVGIPI